VEKEYMAQDAAHQPANILCSISQFERLREKLNMIAGLRMEVWTRGGITLSSPRKSVGIMDHGPIAEDKKGPDVGLIGCRSSGDICIHDSLSSLGGVCAKAVISEGGCGDETIRGEHEEGVLSSQYAEASMLMPWPESTAKSILQSAKNEGVPGTNEGYVEVGASNPCKNSDHVRLKDASSSLGGSCVVGVMKSSWCL
jgi:hypothetical protein